MPKGKPRFPARRCRAVSARTDQDAANRALIAAAREMYAALRFITDRENLTFAECSDAEEIIATAKAAKFAMLVASNSIVSRMAMWCASSMARPSTCIVVIATMGSSSTPTTNARRPTNDAR